MRQERLALSVTVRQVHLPRLIGTLLLGGLFWLIYGWLGLLLAAWLAWWLRPWRRDEALPRNDGLLFGTAALLALAMFLRERWLSIAVPLWLSWWLWHLQRGTIWQPAGRWLIATPLVVVALLVALTALLPFYGNDVAAQSFRDIAASLFDSKRYPPFNWHWPIGKGRWSVGELILDVAIDSHTIFPPIFVLFAGALLRTLWPERHYPRRPAFYGWLTVIAGCAVVFAFAIVDWQRILIWLFD